MTIPKTIDKILSHALGNDQRIIDHFINWLAFILQRRDRTGTAWVLHGTTGTGKGLLMNKILRPLFGMDQTRILTMDGMEESFNSYMECSFLIAVDEVETNTLNKERGVMAKLRNFITEPTIKLRRMYTAAFEIRNYSNWLFFSNMAAPVSIDRNDRRFNVAKYQPDKLLISLSEITQIKKELQTFHDYLAAHDIDEKAATTPLETADRATLIDISQSSIDTVSTALLEGDFAFFIDLLPTNDDYKRNLQTLNKVEDYIKTLQNLSTRTEPNKLHCNIGREELRNIYEYCVGDIPTSPNKFTARLKHHRIHMDVVWIPPQSVRGIKITWKENPNIYNAKLNPSISSQTKLLPKLLAVK